MTDRYKIICLPLVYTGLMHHCIGCDMVAIFDSDYHCWFCGCDPPSGVGSDGDEYRDNWADSIVRYTVNENSDVTIEHLRINDHMKGTYKITNPFWPDDPKPFNPY